MELEGWHPLNDPERSLTFVPDGISFNVSTSNKSLSEEIGKETRGLREEKDTFEKGMNFYL